MKISRNWLTQYVQLNASLEKLCEKLTAAGIEVEAVSTSHRVPDHVVAARIEERTKHPNADSLSVCKVFNGQETLQIVCGAPNCDAGKIVPLAMIGAEFADGEGTFVIRKSKLRGVESFGMMCSAKELGLGEDHDGLMILDGSVAPGTPLRELFPGDSCIEVEVTPNRPDWLSHYGIARDVACQFDLEAKLPSFRIPDPVENPFRDLISVEAPDLCPLYGARVIENVKIGPSPEWMQQRLTAIGLRPINNVVDITNFVMMELGVPLHAFDRSLLEGGRVVVRRAKAGETITTLDGKTWKLSSGNLVIADAVKPMALAGIMGGEYSGVTEKTTCVLLESALFQSSNVRSTSRSLGISTDASYRYERGVDPDMIRTASDRAASLICEYAGGKVVAGYCQQAVELPPCREIVCRFDRVRSLIGMDVPNEEMLRIFRKLGLTLIGSSETQCTVTAPRFRPDLEREADLAEEVARIHGLDNIPMIPVRCSSLASFKQDKYRDTQMLRDRLVGLGLWECYHYSTVSDASALMDTRFRADQLLRMNNPISLDLACLRPSLYGELFATAERNVARRNLSFTLFEIGNVFCKDPALFPEERQEIAIAISGQRHAERYSAELSEAYDFYDLKGIIEAFLDSCRLADVRFEKAQDGRFQAGCCAAVLIDGRVAGHLGQVSDAAAGKLRTPYKLFMATLESAAVLAGRKVQEQYKPFSLFPATTRDVAFAAPADLENAAVLEFIRRSGTKNLEKVELFDIFTDEKALGAGRKSLAYKLTFRRADRTLNDQEVNASYEKLRSKLAKELGVELR